MKFHRMNQLWIKTIPSGPYQTNAYLTGADGSNIAVLIDAPPECFETVTNILEAENRRLAAVLITHPHFDHTLDASRFSKNGIPIFAHPDAVEGIMNPETLGLIPTPQGGFQGARVMKEISGGEKLNLAGMDISILEVPGHSDGSLAFFIPAYNACFPGDVIFQGSIGRTDLPGGDFNILAESIKKAIYTLEDSIVLYPGHGPLTTVGSEKTSNPYVKG